MQTMRNNYMHSDISDAVWRTPGSSPPVTEEDNKESAADDLAWSRPQPQLIPRPLRNPFENRTQRRARERLEAKVAKVAKRIRANLKGLANSALNEMALSQTYICKSRES